MIDALEMVAVPVSAGGAVVDVLMESNYWHAYGSNEKQ